MMRMVSIAATAACSPFFSTLLNSRVTAAYSTNPVKVSN
jgi:hypothetical protein